LLLCGQYPGLSRRVPAQRGHRFYDVVYSVLRLVLCAEGQRKLDAESALCLRRRHRTLLKVRERLRQSLMTSRTARNDTPGERIHGWLRNPATAPRLWLAKPSVAAAWLGLALAFVTPPHGTGFTVCWFKNSTGLPCPGCGLTRSFSCALRGMFLESWHYHP